MDLTTELVRYTGLLIPEQYNTFFLPNVCHVCKSANGGTLISCKYCHMISYCCEDHKLLHLEDHIETCTFMTDLLRTNPWFYTRRLTLHEWIKSTAELSVLIRQKMSRNLLQYECDMFWHAKSCLICHQQTELRVCNICFSANFCPDHEQDFYRYHTQSTCKELLTSLNVSIVSTILAGVSRGLDIDWYFHPIRWSVHIHNFFRLFGSPKYRIRIRHLWRKESLSFFDYVSSDQASNALSLHYGMQVTNLLHLLLTPVCVIHLVVNGYTQSALYAENLLHLLFYYVEEIILVVMNRNVKFETFQIKNLCSKCKSHKKIITVQTCPLLYQNYVFYKTYRRPNMIMLSQPNYNDITKDFFTALQDQNCPILLTAKSQYLAEQIVIKINDTLNMITRPVSIIRNRFNSLMPRKCSDCGTVFYLNFCLIIYENLKNSDDQMIRRSDFGM